MRRLDEYCYLLARVQAWKKRGRGPQHVPVKPASRSNYLCVLVPYRDRQAELDRFIPHMHAFLREQNVSHQIIILNQTDSYRFNRASLINVGWYEADRIGCNYIVMHDVDLLPLNPNISYSYPGIGIVRHISSPQYHPRYKYKNFIGGILLLTLADYKRVNGMSNKYWGWGLEDDDFYLRLKDANLISNLQRPNNLVTNRSNTFLHLHTRDRKRDSGRTTNQKIMYRQRDHIAGLSDVRYEIVSRDLLEYKSGEIIVSTLHISLFCDVTMNQYCEPSSIR